jgi:hypothetical protein
MWNSYDIGSFIGSYFIRAHIHLCIKCVFNAWYSYAKCMNLWMNKLHMIFIINLLNVKFGMWTNHLVSFNPLAWIWCANLSISIQDHGFCLNVNETTFSCIKANLCIDLANPSWPFVNPHNVFHHVSKQNYSTFNFMKTFLKWMFKPHNYVYI